MNRRTNRRVRARSLQPGPSGPWRPDPLTRHSAYPRFGLALSLAVLNGAFPSSALACAACFGQSDSRLASGMNWGIFTLLGVVVFVLGGFGMFLIYLVRRSSQTPPVDEGDSMAEPLR